MRACDEAPEARCGPWEGWVAETVVNGVMSEDLATPFLDATFRIDEQIVATGGCMGWRDVDEERWACGSRMAVGMRVKRTSKSFP